MIVRGEEHVDAYDGPMSGPRLRTNSRGAWGGETDLGEETRRSGAGAKMNSGEGMGGVGPLAPITSSSSSSLISVRETTTIRRDRETLGRQSRQPIEQGTQWHARSHGGVTKRCALSLFEVTVARCAKGEGWC